MRVRVRLVGHLASIANKDIVTVELDERGTISGLCQRLVDSLGSHFGEALLDSVTKDPRTNCLIMVNEREASVLDGSETELKDGDDVTIIPIFHGG
ncbi:MAG: MoaD/ThiS family protein [Candidatus Bathyarchaeia archaeon]